MFTGITELKNRIWSWILRHWPGVCYYIGGAQVLPPPLEREEEREVFARLAEGDESARRTLIERNLRLVVYIARRFDHRPDQGGQYLLPGEKYQTGDLCFPVH